MTEQSTDSQSRSLIYTAPDILRRHWITEVDTGARRLKIARRWLGLKPKTIVDCSLDECVAVGTIEYRSEDAVSYGIYVEMKTGRRHGIPHTDYSHNAAARVATELSAATGLPRRDTTFP
jgi:hypothetical protein